MEDSSIQGEQNVAPTAPIEQQSLDEVQVTISPPDQTTEPDVTVDPMSVDEAAEAGSVSAGSTWQACMMSISRRVLVSAGIVALFLAGHAAKAALMEEDSVPDRWRKSVETSEFGFSDVGIFDTFSVGHFCWGMVLYLFYDDLFNATMWHVQWELFENSMYVFTVSNTLGDIVCGFFGSLLARKLLQSQWLLSSDAWPARTVNAASDVPRALFLKMQSLVNRGTASAAAEIPHAPAETSQLANSGGRVRLSGSDSLAILADGLNKMVSGWRLITLIGQGTHEIDGEKVEVGEVGDILTWMVYTMIWNSLGAYLLCYTKAGMPSVAKKKVVLWTAVTVGSTTITFTLAQILGVAWLEDLAREHAVAFHLSAIMVSCVVATFYVFVLSAAFAWMLQKQSSSAANSDKPKGMSWALPSKMKKQFFNSSESGSQADASQVEC